MKPAFKPTLLKLFAVGVLFYSSYGLANFLASRRAFVPEIAFGWERGIPFWAWTVVPYWSLNLMYAAAFFLCRSVRGQNRYVSRLVAAQCVAFACFVLFPLHFSWENRPTAASQSCCSMRCWRLTRRITRLRRCTSRSR